MLHNHQDRSAHELAPAGRVLLNAKQFDILIATSPRIRQWAKANDVAIEELLVSQPDPRGAYEIAVHGASKANGSPVAHQFTLTPSGESVIVGA